MLVQFEVNNEDVVINTENMIFMRAIKLEEGRAKLRFYFNGDWCDTDEKHPDDVRNDFQRVISSIRLGKQLVEL